MTDLQLRVSKLVDAFMDRIPNQTAVQIGYPEWEAFRQELVAIVTEPDNSPRDEKTLVAENMARALKATDGHVVMAAALIGVAAKTLYLRLGTGKTRKPASTYHRHTKRYGAVAR